jgi:hypothetical protein
MQIKGNSIENFLNATFHDRFLKLSLTFKTQFLSIQNSEHRECGSVDPQLYRASDITITM